MFFLNAYWFFDGRTPRADPVVERRETRRFPRNAEFDTTVVRFGLKTELNPQKTGGQAA